MTTRILTAAAIVLAVAAAPALAGGKPGKSPGNGSGGKIQTGTVSAGTSTGGSPGGFCPPGLAKKNPPCVPPGLARKGVGDHLGSEYPRFDEDGYRMPKLKEGETWYHDGTLVYRADKETRRVIEIIRLTDLIVNG